MCEKFYLSSLLNNNLFMLTLTEKYVILPVGQDNRQAV